MELMPHLTCPLVFMGVEGKILRVFPLSNQDNF